jgi:hypothetical protein
MTIREVGQTFAPIPVNLWRREGIPHVFFRKFPSR